MTILLQMVQAIVGIVVILSIFGLLISVMFLAAGTFPGHSFGPPLIFLLKLLVFGPLFAWLGRVIERRQTHKAAATRPATPEPQTEAAPASGPSVPGRPRGRKRRLLVLTVVLALALPVGLAWSDVARHGLTMGSPCGYGFGERQRALQDKFVVSMFSEPLPAEREIVSFACGGFLDRFAEFTLRMPNAQGQTLGSALAQTYQSGPHNPRFHSSRSLQHMARPGGIVTTYELPGVGGLDVRTLVLDLPTDPAQPATLDFVGWTR